MDNFAANIFFRGGNLLGNLSGFAQADQALDLSHDLAFKISQGLNDRFASNGNFVEPQQIEKIFAQKEDIRLVIYQPSAGPLKPACYLADQTSAASLAQSIVAAGFLSASAQDVETFLLADPSITSQNNLAVENQGQELVFDPFTEAIQGQYVVFSLQESTISETATDQLPRATWLGTNQIAQPKPIRDKQSLFFSFDDSSPLETAWVVSDSDALIQSANQSVSENEITQGYTRLENILEAYLKDPAAFKKDEAEKYQMLLDHTRKTIPWATTEARAAQYLSDESNVRFLVFLNQQQIKGQTGLEDSDLERVYRALDLISAEAGTAKFQEIVAWGVDLCLNRLNDPAAAAEFISQSYKKASELGWLSLTQDFFNQQTLAINSRAYQMIGYFADIGQLAFVTPQLAALLTPQQQKELDDRIKGSYTGIVLNQLENKQYAAVTQKLPLLADSPVKENIVKTILGRADQISGRLNHVSADTKNASPAEIKFSNINSLLGATFAETEEVLQAAIALTEDNPQLKLAYAEQLDRIYQSHLEEINKYKKRVLLYNLQVTGNPISAISTDFVQLIGRAFGIQNTSPISRAAGLEQQESQLLEQQKYLRENIIPQARREIKLLTAYDQGDEISFAEVIDQAVKDDDYSYAYQSLVSVNQSTAAFVVQAEELSAQVFYSNPELALKLATCYRLQNKSAELLQKYKNLSIQALAQEALKQADPWQVVQSLENADQRQALIREIDRQEKKRFADETERARLEKEEQALQKANWATTWRTVIDPWTQGDDVWAINRFVRSVGGVLTVGGRIFRDNFLLSVPLKEISGWWNYTSENAQIEAVQIDLNYGAYPNHSVSQNPAATEGPVFVNAQSGWNRFWEGLVRGAGRIATPFVQTDWGRFSNGQVEIPVGVQFDKNGNYVMSKIFASTNSEFMLREAGHSRQQILDLVFSLPPEVAARMVKAARANLDYRGYFHEENYLMDGDLYTRSEVTLTQDWEKLNQELQKKYGISAVDLKTFYEMDFDSNGQLGSYLIGRGTDNSGQRQAQTTLHQIDIQNRQRQRQRWYHALDTVDVNRQNEKYMGHDFRPMDVLSLPFQIVTYVENAVQLIPGAPWNAIENAYGDIDQMDRDLAGLDLFCRFQELGYTNVDQLLAKSDRELAQILFENCPELFPEQEPKINLEIPELSLLVDLDPVNRAAVELQGKLLSLRRFAQNNPYVLSRWAQQRAGQGQDASFLTARRLEVDAHYYQSLGYHRGAYELLLEANRTNPLVTSKGEVNHAYTSYQINNQLTNAGEFLEQGGNLTIGILFCMVAGQGIAAIGKTPAWQAFLQKPIVIKTRALYSRKVAWIKQLPGIKQYSQWRQPRIFRKAQAKGPGTIDKTLSQWKGTLTQEETEQLLAWKSRLAASDLTAAKAQEIMNSLTAFRMQMAMSHIFHPSSLKTLFVDNYTSFYFPRNAQGFYEWLDEAIDEGFGNDFENCKAFTTMFFSGLFGHGGSANVVVNTNSRVYQEEVSRIINANLQVQKPIDINSYGEHEELVDGRLVIQEIGQTEAGLPIYRFTVYDGQREISSSNNFFEIMANCDFKLNQSAKSGGTISLSGDKIRDLRKATAQAEGPVFRASLEERLNQTIVDLAKLEGKTDPASVTRRQQLEFEKATLDQQMARLKLSDIQAELDKYKLAIDQSQLGSYLILRQNYLEAKRHLIKAQQEVQSTFLRLSGQKETASDQAVQDLYETVDRSWEKEVAVLSFLEEKLKLGTISVEQIFDLTTKLEDIDTQLATLETVVRQIAENLAKTKSSKEQEALAYELRLARSKFNLLLDQRNSLLDEALTESTPAKKQPAVDLPANPQEAWIHGNQGWRNVNGLVYDQMGNFVGLQSGDGAAGAAVNGPAPQTAQKTEQAETESQTVQVAFSAAEVETRVQNILSLPADQAVAETQRLLLELGRDEALSFQGKGHNPEAEAVLVAKCLADPVFLEIVLESIRSSQYDKTASEGLHILSLVAQKITENEKPGPLDAASVKAKEEIVDLLLETITPGWAKEASDISILGDTAYALRIKAFDVLTCLKITNPNQLERAAQLSQDIALDVHREYRSGSKAFQRTGSPEAVRLKAISFLGGLDLTILNKSTRLRVASRIVYTLGRLTFDNYFFHVRKGTGLLASLSRSNREKSPYVESDRVRSEAAEAMGKIAQFLPAENTDLLARQYGLADAPRFLRRYLTQIGLAKRMQRELNRTGNQILADGLEKGLTNLANNSAEVRSFILKQPLVFRLIEGAKRIWLSWQRRGEKFKANSLWADFLYLDDHEGDYDYIRETFKQRLKQWGYFGDVRAESKRQQIIHHLNILGGLRFDLNQESGQEEFKATFDRIVELLEEGIKDQQLGIVTSAIINLDNLSRQHEESLRQLGQIKDLNKIQKKIKEKIKQVLDICQKQASNQANPAYLRILAIEALASLDSISGLEVLNRLGQIIVSLDEEIKSTQTQLEALPENAVSSRKKLEEKLSSLKQLKETSENKLAASLKSSGLEPQAQEEILKGLPEQSGQNVQVILDKTTLQEAVITQVDKKGSVLNLEHHKEVLSQAPTAGGEAARLEFLTSYYRNLLANLMAAGVDIATIQDIALAPLPTGLGGLTRDQALEAQRIIASEAIRALTEQAQSLAGQSASTIDNTRLKAIEEIKMSLHTLYYRSKASESQMTIARETYRGYKQVRIAELTCQVLQSDRLLSSRQEALLELSRLADPATIRQVLERLAQQNSLETNPAEAGQLAILGEDLMKLAEKKHDEISRVVKEIQDTAEKRSKITKAEAIEKNTARLRQNLHQLASLNAVDELSELAISRPQLAGLVFQELKWLAERLFRVEMIISAIGQHLSEIGRFEGTKDPDPLIFFLAETVDFDYDAYWADYEKNKKTGQPQLPVDDKLIERYSKKNPLLLARYLADSQKSGTVEEDYLGAANVGQVQDKMQQILLELIELRQQRLEVRSEKALKELDAKINQRLTEITDELQPLVQGLENLNIMNDRYGPMSHNRALEAMEAVFGPANKKVEDFLAEYDKLRMEFIPPAIRQRVEVQQALIAEIATDKIMESRLSIWRAELTGMVAAPLLISEICGSWEKQATAARTGNQAMATAYRESNQKLLADSERRLRNIKMYLQNQSGVSDEKTAKAEVPPGYRLIDIISGDFTHADPHDVPILEAIRAEVLTSYNIDPSSYRPLSAEIISADKLSHQEILDLVSQLPAAGVLDRCQTALASLNNQLYLESHPATQKVREYIAAGLSLKEAIAQTRQELPKDEAWRLTDPPKKLLGIIQDSNSVLDRLEKAADFYLTKNTDGRKYTDWEIINLGLWGMTALGQEETTSPSEEVAATEDAQPADRGFLHHFPSLGRSFLEGEFLPKLLQAGFYEAEADQQVEILKSVVEEFARTFTTDKEQMMRSEDGSKSYARPGDFQLIIKDASDRGWHFASEQEVMSNVQDEAFAIITNLEETVNGVRLFDFQLAAGNAQAMGLNTVLGTGEGKTYVDILPAFLASLTGRGVHMMTANDYLAKELLEAFAAFKKAGLNVAIIQMPEGGSLKSLETARQALQADITIGTAQTFAFIYAFDTQIASPHLKLLRRDFPFHAALIDEIDFSTLWESITQLIISGGQNEVIRPDQVLSKLTGTGMKVGLYYFLLPQTIFGAALFGKDVIGLGKGIFSLLGTIIDLPIRAKDWMETGTWRKGSGQDLTKQDATAWESIIKFFKNNREFERHLRAIDEIIPILKKNVDYTENLHNCPDQPTINLTESGRRKIIEHFLASADLISLGLQEGPDFARRSTSNIAIDFKANSGSLVSLDNVVLTDQGWAKVMEAVQAGKLATYISPDGRLAGQNAQDMQASETSILQALLVQEFYNIDDQFIYDHGEAVLLSMLTGRPMEGRQLENNLQFAVVMKLWHEGYNVKLLLESRSQFTMAFQSFFKYYTWGMAGSTGTFPFVNANEYFNTYLQGKNIPGLRSPFSAVVNIPRVNLQHGFRCAPTYYVKKSDWLKGLAEDALQQHKRGRSQLILFEKAEDAKQLALYLANYGLKVNLLTGENIKDEDLVVEKAGQSGQITIATQTMTRGTNVKVSSSSLNQGGLAVHRVYDQDECNNLQGDGRSGRFGQVGSNQISLYLIDDAFSVTNPKQIETSHEFGHRSLYRLLERFGSMSALCQALGIPWESSADVFGIKEMTWQTTFLDDLLKEMGEETVVKMLGLEAQWQQLKTRREEAVADAKTAYAKPDESYRRIQAISEAEYNFHKALYDLLRQNIFRRQGQVTLVADKFLPQYLKFASDQAGHNQVGFIDYLFSNNKSSLLDTSGQPLPSVLEQVIGLTQLEEKFQQLESTCRQEVDKLGLAADEVKDLAAVKEKMAEIDRKIEGSELDEEQVQELLDEKSQLESEPLDDQGQEAENTKQRLAEIDQTLQGMGLNENQIKALQDERAKLAEADKLLSQLEQDKKTSLKEALFSTDGNGRLGLRLDLPLEIYQIFERSLIESQEESQKLVNLESIADRYFADDQVDPRYFGVFRELVCDETIARATELGGDSQDGQISQGSAAYTALNQSLFPTARRNYETHSADSRQMTGILFEKYDQVQHFFIDLAERLVNWREKPLERIQLLTWNFIQKMRLKPEPINNSEIEHVLQGLLDEYGYGFYETKLQFPEGRSPQCPFEANQGIAKRIAEARSIWQEDSIGKQNLIEIIKLALQQLIDAREQILAEVENSTDMMFYKLLNNPTPEMEREKKAELLASKLEDHFKQSLARVYAMTMSSRQLGWVEIISVENAATFDEAQAEAQVLFSLFSNGLNPSGWEILTHPFEPTAGQDLDGALAKLENILSSNSAFVLVLGAQNLSSQAVMLYNNIVTLARFNPAFREDIYQHLSDRIKKEENEAVRTRLQNLQKRLQSLVAKQAQRFETIRGQVSEINLRLEQMTQQKDYRPQSLEIIDGKKWPIKRQPPAKINLEIRDILLKNNSQLAAKMTSLEKEGYFVKGGCLHEELTALLKAAGLLSAKGVIEFNEGTLQFLQDLREGKIEKPAAQEERSRKPKTRKRKAGAKKKKTLETANSR